MAKQITSQGTVYETTYADPCVDDLRPNSKVVVYHGTREKHVAELINGFDATFEMPRYYNAPRHRGLFVTRDMQTAERFAGGRRGYVFEIETRAKFLHGTDFGGRIETRRPMRSDDARWLRRKYPHTFRPTLSETLCADSVEPQAILIGVVKPSQVLGVYTQGERYSRRAFFRKFAERLDLVKFNFSPFTPPYTFEKLVRTLVTLDYGDEEETREVLSRTSARTVRSMLSSIFPPAAVEGYMAAIEG